MLKRAGVSFAPIDFPRHPRLHSWSIRAKSSERHLGRCRRHCPGPQSPSGDPTPQRPTSKSPPLIRAGQLLQDRSARPHHPRTRRSRAATRLRFPSWNWAILLMIHRTRDSPKAKSTRPWRRPYAVIDEGVAIGPHCKIGPHVHITGALRLAPATFLHAAVIGEAPQDVSTAASPHPPHRRPQRLPRARHDSPLHQPAEETVIGSHNLLMAIPTRVITCGWRLRHARQWRAPRWLCQR